MSLVFDRATGGSGTMLAGLPLAFGIGGVAGNLGAGGLTDRLGSRAVVNLAVAVFAINSALLPLSSSYFASALVAMAVWGVPGWAIMVPQQHRLISISPGAPPLVVAHQLEFFAAGVLVLGLLASEIARRFGRPVRPGTRRCLSPGRRRGPRQRPRGPPSGPARKPPRRIVRIRSPIDGCGRVW